MKAVTFQGVGDVKVEDVADPEIADPTDVVVRITTSAVCGSDLHQYHGRGGGLVERGAVMGHEFMGIVEELGSAVKAVRAGEAERIRVPFADYLCERVPPTMTDDDALFLGDILSTAYCCAENGGIRPGDVVAVFGAGPVGLLAMQSAQLFGPARVFAVDRVDYRLALAAELGAEPVNVDTSDPAEQLRALTDGRGPDVVLECVGHETPFTQAIQAVRAGGAVSSVGVYVETTMGFPAREAFFKDLSLKMGICNARNYIMRWLHVLGPGLITGASDDDPSGITTYSVAGASLGYATLWTALATFPLMAAVQLTCARIGLVTGRGLVGCVRRHYPRSFLYVACLLLLVANVFNIAADLAGMADVVTMLTGLPAMIFVPVVGAAIVAMTIWASYATVVAYLKWLTVVLFAYIVAGFLAKPDWGAASSGRRRSRSRRSARAAEARSRPDGARHRMSFAMPAST